MAILIIYVLVALGVAIGVKLKENEFINRMVDEEDGDSFIEKQVVFSLFWPLILSIVIITSPYFVIMGLNKLIDKINKK